MVLPKVITLCGIYCSNKLHNDVALNKRSWNFSNEVQESLRLCSRAVVPDLGYPYSWEKSRGIFSLVNYSNWRKKPYMLFCTRNWAILFSFLRLWKQKQIGNPCYWKLLFLASLYSILLKIDPLFGPKDLKLNIFRPCRNLKY